MKIKRALLIFLPLLLITLALRAQTDKKSDDSNSLELAQEKHLRNVRQLTFGGENAEAYFSGDGKQLIFQAKRESRQCDQIYKMNADGTGTEMVSTGMGVTTCSYFYPNGKRLLYSSTHLGAKECPPKPDRSQGYVWAIYPDFDIFTARPDGRDVKQLTKTPGYDAEATISTDGKKIVFTSMRDGDLDIYTMDADGKNVRRLTDELGYDGGPFFSRDGKQIVYRSFHPKTEEEVKRYKQRLEENLIEPNVFEVWVMNADGTNKRQVTNLGKASFAPYFLPDGKRIIFASNVHDPKKRDFDLYVINVDGSSLERITFNDSFDGFPMFSPDGKKLVFASNRNAATRGDTNVFIADWVE
ncbi:MAG: PD40 domain-containing protein [Pyrinomonadaceae bacterium]|nr:PD40 domain-containing protein [Pyrinomonadaceae bacterium]